MERQQVIELKNEVRRGIRNPDSRVLRLLSTLHREARAAGDNSLMGFVCFHYADYYFFMEPDTEKFYRYLKKAVGSMLDCEDRSMLGHAYNLLGVDAHTHGSYTIAFHYYLTAKKLGEEHGDEVLGSAVSANIARLMTELANHKQAETYLLESLKQLMKEGYQESNTLPALTIYYLRGINAVFLNKKKIALDSKKRIEDVLEDCPEDVRRAFRLAYLFLQAQITLMGKKQSALPAYINEMIPLIREEVALFDCMEDIRYLGEALLEQGYPDYVEQILAAAAVKIPDCGITRIERMYYELELKYYTAVHAERRAAESRLCLSDCIARQDDEQTAYSLRAIALSTMMADLRFKQQEAQKENLLLRRQADTDSLTRLPNRYALNDRVDRTLDAARSEQHMLGIGILDIDYFKQYNDTYGHRAGDACLKKIGAALKELGREEDVFCARYGGDEFVILAEDADARRLKRIARHLNEIIAREAIPHKGSEVSACVTVTQGYCCGIPKGETTLWDFFAEADKALYRAKEARTKKDASGRIPVRILNRGTSRT